MSSRMPKLPSLPKMKSVYRCECGCNGLTGNRFVPGHDAKLLGMVKRVKAGVWAEDADTVAQLDGLAAWADVNLPGQRGDAYAAAVAREMRVEWTPVADREEEKAG